jgi:hypothetical protein
MGCGFCHKGNESGAGKEAAHAGLVKRPSDNLNVCGACHSKIASDYAKSLHYTSAGQRHGVLGRFSPAEAKAFDKKVFQASCRSCHAACGDCHVQGPVIGGLSIGLIKEHKFVKKNEGKTCAFCHGGRVYPEFVGEYGGNADVHYQKGMLCMDCHKKAEMHGDGTAYVSKNDVKERPRCLNCHKLGGENLLTARFAHGRHLDKVSCYGCHSAGEYRNCYNCHLGTGATSKPGFYLGLDPRDKKIVTTLRLIPTVRDTFAKAGIEMAHYDALPNYWNSAVHNIRKRTERTLYCDACHVEKKGFLTKGMLIKDGSKANEGLIYSPKPITQ